MRLFNSPTGYGAVAQVLHWVTVVLVILAWTLGIFGDLLPRGEPRHAGLFIHIVAGISVIVLLIARLIWRLVDSRPLSETAKFSTLLGRWVDPLAGIAHYALYSLLVVVPVFGTSRIESSAGRRNRCSVISRAQLTRTATYARSSTDGRIAEHVVIAPGTRPHPTR